MSIQIGDTLPSIELKTPGAEGPQAINTGDIFAGKKSCSSLCLALLHRGVLRRTCRAMW